MIRYIILESLFDALKRAVTILSVSSVDTTLYGVSKSAPDEVQAKGSLADVDNITEHRNKGGLFLPPVALLPFRTRARSLIKKLVHVMRIYDDVLIDAAEAVNSDPELKILWKTWYDKFNPNLNFLHQLCVRCGA